MFKSFARFFLTITTAAVLALPLSASAYAAGANPITLDTSAWAGTSGTIKAAYAGYPVKLGAATLARIDHQRPPLQRHARKSAGHDADAVTTGEHEGAQIDVPGRDALLHAGRAGR